MLKHSNKICKHIITIVCIIFMLLSLSSCSVKEKNISPCIYGNLNNYSNILQSQFTDYTLKEKPINENIFTLVDDKNIVTCLDVQANSSVLDLLEIKFIPQGLLTIVFTINKNMTDLRPSSWQELMDSGLKVKYPDNSNDNNIVFRASMASIAYGLDGENYTNKNVINYLKKLKKADRLEISDSNDCPITICFDAQAVNLIKQGQNLQIVVPKDGTLSFSFGILCKNVMVINNQDSLIKQHFRLLNGESDNIYYPDTEQYTYSSLVSNFELFNNVTKNATIDIRRTVLGTRYSNSADCKENIMLIPSFIVLIILWTTFSIQRAFDKKSARWLYLISAMTILWLLLSMFKYMLPINTLLNRICWYSYYIFLIGLPLIFLYISAVIGKPKDNKKIHIWFIQFVIIFVVLLLLIFTNDLHQLVFKFKDISKFDSTYSYGILYYFIYAFDIISLVLALTLFIIKSSQNPSKRAWIMPVFVALLLLLFSIGNICGIRFFKESNMALVFSIFSILIFESLFEAGFIPTNKGYSALFSSSPLNMQILDKNFNTQFKSKGASELTILQKKSLSLSPETPILKDENTLVHGCSIHGGTAIWQEDITTIQNFHNKLKKSIENTQKANIFLQKENQIAKQKISLDIKEQLFNELENDIKEKTQELSNIIKNISSSKNKTKQFSYIPLLLCHIKRRCNLFFLSQENNLMSSGELAMYIDELSEFASLAKVKSLAQCGLINQISVCHAIICYDFYFSILRYAIINNIKTIIAQLQEQNEDIIFSILVSEKIDTTAFSESFRKSLQDVRASISYKEIDENTNISLLIPKLGGKKL